MSINLRASGGDLSYLDMDGLSYLIDNEKGTGVPCLANDADEYKPVRNAMAHTALLTEAAKVKLTSVFNNIKARLLILLSK